MGHDDREHEGEDAHGSFSTGQEREDDAPEKEHRGDFAEGQQAGHTSVHDDRGDFAEGQEQPGHGHGEPGGDYGRGLHHDHDHADHDHHDHDHDHHDHG